MPLNHFNTTPATHPELYRDEVYMGRCKQLTPGQSISAEVCARWMAVIAVNYGWNVGDIAIQVALTMRRKMCVAIFPDEEQAHGVTACAFAAEIRRRIAAVEGCEDVLKLFNAAVEDEMPYHRYGYDGENCRTGGSLFCKFFGVAGIHIYSEYAAVNGDVFGSMMQRIRNVVSNMLPRVTTDTRPQYAEKIPAGKIAGNVVSERDGANAIVENSIKKSSNSNLREPIRTQNGSNKQGCLLPLVLFVGIVLTLTGLAATVLY